MREEKECFNFQWVFHFEPFQLCFWHTGSFSVHAGAVSEEEGWVEDESSFLQAEFTQGSECIWEKDQEEMFSLLVPCAFSFSHMNVVCLPSCPYCWVCRCCLSFFSAPGNMILLSFIRFRGTQWRCGTFWHYYSISDPWVLLCPWCLAEASVRGIPFATDKKIIYLSWL